MKMSVYTYSAVPLASEQNIWGKIIEHFSTCTLTKQNETMASLQCLNLLFG